MLERKLASLGVAVVAATLIHSPVTAGDHEVVLASEVEWEQLNPARGDKSPKAATLWGDRNGSEPTGFLVQFVDGFSSPPHIHNVSYRGVVISGLIHNDDPDAAHMWMPAGSFWTQPKGEVHITAAKGTTNMAYIEIEASPYLVRPPDQAFDSGERPVNVDASNLVWLDPPGSRDSAGGAKVAFVWGKPEGDALRGTLIKLPAGFSGKIESHGPSLRSVTVQGRARHQMPGETDAKILDPGSYVAATGKSIHQITSESEEPCVLYVRSEGGFEISTTN